MPIIFNRHDIPWLDGFAIIEGTSKCVTVEFCDEVPMWYTKEEWCKVLNVTSEQYDEAHQYAVEHAYELAVNHHQHFLLFRQRLWNRRAERANR